MGMKEIQAEAYRRKRLRLLNTQWRKADLKVAECEDRIRAIKRNGAKDWEEEIAKEKMLLLELKAKRLHINIKLSKLSPMFEVGEEIH